MVLARKEVTTSRICISCGVSSRRSEDDSRRTPITWPRLLRGTVTIETMPSRAHASPYWILGSLAQSRIVTARPSSASATLFSASTGPLSRNSLLSP